MVGLPGAPLPSLFINAFSIFDFLKPTESENVPVPTATPGVRSVTHAQGLGLLLGLFGHVESPHLRPVFSMTVFAEPCPRGLAFIINVQSS